MFNIRMCEGCFQEKNFSVEIFLFLITMMPKGENGHSEMKVNAKNIISTIIIRNNCHAKKIPPGEQFIHFDIDARETKSFSTFLSTLKIKPINFSPTLTGI